MYVKLARIKKKFRTISKVAKKSNFQKKMLLFEQISIFRALVFCIHP